MDPGAQRWPSGPSPCHFSAQFSSRLTLLLDEHFPFDCKMVVTSWPYYLKILSLGEKFELKSGASSSLSKLATPMRYSVWLGLDRLFVLDRVEGGGGHLDHRDCENKKEEAPRRETAQSTDVHCSGPFVHGFREGFCGFTKLQEANLCFFLLLWFPIVPYMCFENVPFLNPNGCCRISHFIPS